MDHIDIVIANERFKARFRDDLSPATCARFRAMLPFSNRLIHVRWSGEACWIPLGDLAIDLPSENATSFPAPGDVILYPGGVSEVEILVAYGGVRFASKAGQLAGNPLLAIVDGLDRLAEIGRETLWKGAVDVSFRHGIER